MVSDVTCSASQRSSRTLASRLSVQLGIGATGFEPATFRPPAGCATRLRHAPSRTGVYASFRSSLMGTCVRSMNALAKPQSAIAAEALKPVEEFSWRQKATGQRDTFCRPCRSAHGKEHYLANRERYIDQARRQKRALAQERTRCLLEFFSTHPCVDCGESDPSVLEFDHLRDKVFAIGTKLSTRSWRSILAEIENARWCAPTVTGGARPAEGAPCAPSSPESEGFVRSGRRESNPRFELGRLTCNRYTTPADAIRS